MTRPFIRNQPQRILICGDRHWTNYNLLRNVLQQHLAPAHDIIIHGDARGADRMGAEIAKQLGVTKDRILAYPADWTKHHKAAGPIRNRQMLTEGNPTLVLAFHGDIRSSKGTKDMVNIALRAGLQVWLNGLLLQNERKK